MRSLECLALQRGVLNHVTLSCKRPIEMQSSETVEITNIKQLDCRLLPETPARSSAICSMGEIHTNTQLNFVRQKEEEGRGFQANRNGHFGRVKRRKR